MEHRSSSNHKKDIQFIVNDGIIYNKRDIMSLLWDLGYITYFEVEGEAVTNKGKGFIMRVSLNNEDPTLFLNGRVYINAGSFDYMRVKKIKEALTMYELYSDKRVIKIVPDNKKQNVPPFRYMADSIVGLDVIADEEFPPENMEDPPSGFKDLPPES